MKKGQYLRALLDCQRSVFTTTDIAQLWGEARTGRLRARLQYYVQSGELVRIRKGLYAKDRKYDRLEMATCLYKPSYVSFESVLWHEGLIHQPAASIFVASYLSREIHCDGQIIRIHKVRRALLKKSYGIQELPGYPVASIERAFLDTLRRSRYFRFDNLDSLDWKFVFRLLPLYRNKRLFRKVYSMHGGRS
jgi:predicted transcriptional regulator of viral defense system